MLERLRSNNALFWVVGEHFHQEIIALVIEHVVQVVIISQIAHAVVLRHLDLLEDRHLLVLGPDLRVRCPKRLEYKVDHLDRRIASKQSSHSDHLEENTANRPHINRDRILSGAEQQLRRAVPHRHHLVRVGAQRHGESSGETKVRNLDHVVISEQNVLGLQIPMHNAVAVDRMYALQNLNQILLDNRRQMLGDRRVLLDCFAVMHNKS